MDYRCIISTELNTNKDHCGWFCDSVTVTNSNQKSILFNIYDVVADELAVRSGKGLSKIQRFFI